MSNLPKTERRRRRRRSMGPFKTIEKDIDH
jgi:hypothetical protein